MAFEFLKKLKDGLSKTRQVLGQKIAEVITGKKVDAATLEELEGALLSADVGVSATEEIISTLKKASPDSDLREVLKSEVVRLLSCSESRVPSPESLPPPHALRLTPYVILVIGVNGTGKTTTIAKLAKRYKDEGKKVLIAAGDTYRAAAVEQLGVWARRAGVDLIESRMGQDPAAVAYDAVAGARSRGAEVLIIDTAGRLHTKSNLMEELVKVKRVIAKHDPGFPQEVLLVLDATTGQNAISQAKLFTGAVGVTGIALTKLDGTARGGIVIAIAKELGIPVKYIGVGEKLDDLADFDPAAFAEALIGQ
jgi:fused signal recognition particle receptor